MTIIPLKDKVLIKPLPPEESKTIGGIVVPSGVNMADLTKGVIVCVSDELKKHYTPGDIILYPSGAGLGEYYKGEYHVWLRDDNREIWSKVVE